PSEAMVFPLRVGAEQTGKEKALSHMQKYFEETWIHRPRRALGNNAPVDAVGHTTLRKKLRGVIQFLQDCATGGLVGKYDFDRLSRKLGLLAGGPAPAAAPAASAASEGAPSANVGDIPAMGAAEL